MSYKMIIPPSLKKGDTIGLVGTSTPLPNASVDDRIGYYESLGLNVVIGESCRWKRGYLCGDDKARAHEINTMFANEHIHAIISYRGGYGSQRILDYIDFECIRQNPKIFCGYSDVTALHIAINQRSNLVTYHTPMFVTEPSKLTDEYTVKGMEKVLFQTINDLNLKNPKDLEMLSLHEGKGKGILVGGNLSLLSSSLGTPYEVDTRDKILFIEEVDEEPYRIDRMLNQLRLAGKFRESAGIILGAFTDCEPEFPERSLTLAQVFDDLIVSEGVPVIGNVACGHTVPTMSLPLGVEVQLVAEKNKCSIIICQ